MREGKFCTQLTQAARKRSEGAQAQRGPMLVPAEATMAAARRLRSKR